MGAVRWVAAGLLWCLLGVAQASQIQVLALFANKALVVVDGRQKLLSVGGEPFEGVRLLAADAASALVAVNGRRERLTLDQAISSHYAQPRQQVVRIWPNGQSMYMVEGAVNGRSVRLMVDTGSNAVAMNTADARRFGIDYRSGHRGVAQTASGRVPAYRVNLDRVRVGGITL